MSQKPRATKKKTIAKKKTKVAAAPTEEQPDTAAVALVAVSPAAAEIKTLDERLQESLEEFKDFKAMSRGFCNHQIELLQEARKEIRLLKKSQKKPREKKDPKKPSVFETPIPISNALADFLGKPHGTEMSRNDVTHELHAYCNEHNLMEEGNRRNINPDAEFKKLLKNIPAGTQLTWLNIQTYIKHHYE